MIDPDILTYPLHLPAQLLRIIRKDESTIWTDLLETARSCWDGKAKRAGVGKFGVLGRFVSLGSIREATD
jgi:hypothetical protein